MAKLPVNKKSKKVDGPVRTASNSKKTITHPKKNFKKKNGERKEGRPGIKTRPKKNLKKNDGRKRGPSGTPGKPGTKNTASKLRNTQMRKRGKPKSLGGARTKIRKNTRREHDRRARPDLHKKTITLRKTYKSAKEKHEKLMKKFRKVTETPAVKNEKIDPLQLINFEMLQAAVSGLRKLPTAGKSEKNSLHDVTDEDERLVYLQVTLCKLPKVNEDMHLTGPTTVNVYLPHTLVTDNTDVILITKDLQKGYKPDHQNSLDHFKELLHKHGAAALVNEVIPLRQLKVEYKEYEAKRLLSNRTDVLLCDDTIMRFIPKFLSKHFYTKKKLPVQVNLKADDLVKELQRALSVSRLFFSMKGNSSIMKIGRLSQTDDEIQQNVLEAVRKLASFVPGKWTNIQGLSLKLERTTSIPLYIKMDSLNSVKPLPSKRIFPGEPVFGTLSTQPRRCITVFPDGSVTCSSYSKNYERIAEEEEATSSQETAKKEKMEPDPKVGKKGSKRGKRKSAESMETEPSSTKEEAKKSSNKRKAKEGKSSKVKKQKKEQDSESESDSGEEDLEEQEMMYLRQLSQSDDVARDQDEAEDSEDVWADSESEVEESE